MLEYPSAPIVRYLKVSVNAFEVYLKDLELVCEVVINFKDISVSLSLIRDPHVL